MATTITYTNFSYFYHSGTLLGKLMRLPLQLVPKGVAIKIQSGMAKGMIWVTGTHVHGCWLGTYEKDKQEYCAKLISPGMIVFDIGANAGFYTLLFARLVKDGHVVSFEPDSANMSSLRRHVVLNSLLNVSLVQAAASDNTSLTGFSLNGGATGRMDAKSSYLVPTLRLDELLNDGTLPFPDVIKMDVEGAEALVIAGARNLISRNTCVWIIALHGELAKQECFKIFSEAGYELQDLQGRSINHETFEADEFVAIPR